MKIGNMPVKLPFKGNEDEQKYTRVKVWDYQASQPIFKTDTADNTYQKGDLFCIADKSNNLVTKIPMNNIFRVQETYSPLKSGESWIA